MNIRLGFFILFSIGIAQLSIASSQPPEKGKEKAVEQQAPKPENGTQKESIVKKNLEIPVGLKGSVEAGKSKMQTCVACHSDDGNSTVPNWPKLAGQYEQYLVKELADFRMGEQGPRFEPSMYGMTANLSDQDIVDLSAYYASQKQTLGKAKQEYVSLGEKIYRGGNLKTGVSACLACHGPEGLGNEAAKFPRLAGQHALYTENMLRAFRDGKRKNSPNGMMESIAQKMSDEEIKAVSSYIEGLS